MRPSLPWLLVAIATVWLSGPVRSQRWSFTSIGQGFQSDDHSWEDEEKILDYRYISYRQNLKTGSLFVDRNDLVSGVQLTLDEDRDQLLVGGRNALYRLHLDNLTLVQRTNWPSSQESITLCLNRGQKEAFCHNFIRVLLLLNNTGKVFTCGTNAFDPDCTWRNANDLNVVTGTMDGRGVSPYSPDYNATSLMTSDGSLYTATVIDFSARDPAILRRTEESYGTLRTLKGNSQWLDHPNFVSTYEIGNFIYFFFRETAVEYLNCGKKIYSRAARVCKNDKGGLASLQSTWTSYLKVRLNCSLPGEFPFYFDEIQSTFFAKDADLIYAVFTTPPNSIAGSAVCVFHRETIEEAFNGPYKYQDTPSHAWVKSSFNSRRDCNGSKRTSHVMSEADVFMSAKKYQLMNKAVAPSVVGPLIMRKNERWTHIVVDEVITKNGLMDVLFLATEDGRLRKMVRLPNSETTCLIEEIKIVENGASKPVHNMNIASEKGAVYISMEGKILKVPVQRCYRFTSSRMCIAANDPYCGWNTTTQECTPAPDQNAHSDGWEQDISQCPVLTFPVNGDWGQWSDWSVCQQVGVDRMVDRCKCRSRNCDNPRPTNNGMECRGPSMQVSDCTVHGAWTTWSAWSACSQTCGWAMKTRSRQCGNPPPKFGGNPCQGKSMERIYCNETKACPDVSVDGMWSPWSGWSGCTRNCNSGIQTRRRGCNRPAPRHNGRLCSGNREEWRMCNTHRCPDKIRVSPWTEWIQTNRTKGGYFQQRYRFHCRANVEAVRDIKTSFARSQAEFCFSNGKGCYDKKELADTMTNIQQFSAVDSVLKKYCWKRRRFLKKRYCRCRTLGVFLVCRKCELG